MVSPEVRENHRHIDFGYAFREKCGNSKAARLRRLCQNTARLSHSAPEIPPFRGWAGAYDAVIGAIAPFGNSNTGYFLVVSVAVASK